MTKNLLALLFAASMGGCAVVSGSPAQSSTPIVHNDSMSSLPPEPQKEEAPMLEATQVWVPGYYEPVAGAWMWHKGRVTDAKDGYKLAPASYREEGGKVVFTPLRWRRVDLANSTASK